MSARTEIDTASPEYHDGWHDGIANHAPRDIAPDYLAGWDEGFRFRLRGAEREVYVSLPSDLERRK